MGGALGVIGKIASLAGVYFGTTSFMPQADARKALIADYGYDYWRYLKGRHPGTNPYSFNPEDGDLPPQAFKATHGEIRVHVDVHDHTSSGIRSKVRSQGQIHTSPINPGVLQLEAASQGHHP
jgi:hypothetical protein